MNIHHCEEDPHNDGLSIHARVTYAEVEAAGPAARPLEFPAPSVHRGARIAVKGREPKTDKIYTFSNVLIRVPDGARRTLTEEALPDVGYCIRRKLSDSVYGSVRLGVVMRRRTQLYCGGGTNGISQRTLDVIGEGEEFEDGGTFVPDESDVVWDATNELVAVKIISWAKVRNLRGKHLEDPIKEVAAMQLLGDYHPNIVGSVDLLQDDKYLYSIIPYCSGGDLYSRVIEEINKKECLETAEAQARVWFRQILMGLDHFQRKGVCHRDLSLDNLLLHDDNVIIIDLGMCLRVPFSDPVNQGCVTDVSAGTMRRLIQAQGQGGKWMYMAPEIAARDDQFDGFAADIWAAGVILYVMLVGRAPFKWANEGDEHFKLFANGHLREALVSWEISISDEACDLLQNMFWRDPIRRLSLAQVMEHPWVVGHQ
uniref:Protein kinase domain-containing protein n=1 Tax=Helicotheca tamesis TaxID=374047 RepID=A0A7S2GVE6_9STRA|mmetsp:Transcript_12489/g.17202  ORF Transcript_12489/g.17202 Transcript_12489/m.17202 type:complete len:426 (+) Transcript_12489:124-1401(+)|eukprot:CAMPEP_0185735524 /NCGR_PEP_ID=MMETSP1171-20130828/25471_1 /TAXON_ID=374046 /ORGANISM="Helicotheca tamensis, Strain CCMP826" /LENGTH=425 /DNA_ID=CAMNT_0028405861 /DNA_START=85 /DNA_END=1365 /DNA_ORIENTATION=+